MTKNSNTETKKKQQTLASKVAWLCIKQLTSWHFSIRAQDSLKCPKRNQTNISRSNVARRETFDNQTNDKFKCFNKSAMQLQLSTPSSHAQMICVPAPQFLKTFRKLIQQQNNSSKCSAFQLHTQNAIWTFCRCATPFTDGRRHSQRFRHLPDMKHRIVN